MKYPLIFFTMLISCCGFSTAYGLCGLENDLPALNMSMVETESTQVEAGSPYTMSGQLSEFELAGEHWKLNHQYQQLAYDRSLADTPITNGHLHQLTVAYSNQGSATEGFDWAVQPVLAVSSNQVRHSHSLNGSAFRLEAYFNWHYSWQRGQQVYLGACATDSTGDYQLLPVLALQYQYQDLEFVLGYPYSRFKFSLMPEFSLLVEWSLQGQQWQVLDNALQNRSDLHYAVEQLSLGLQLELNHNHRFRLFWLRQFDASLEYLDRNLNRVNSNVEDTEGWLFGYSYLL